MASLSAYVRLCGLPCSGIALLVSHLYVCIVFLLPFWPLPLLPFISLPERVRVSSGAAFRFS